MAADQVGEGVVDVGQLVAREIGDLEAAIVNGPARVVADDTSWPRGGGEGDADETSGKASSESAPAASIDHLEIEIAEEKEEEKEGVR